MWTVAIISSPFAISYILFRWAGSLGEIPLLKQAYFIAFYMGYVVHRNPHQLDGVGYCLGLFIASIIMVGFTAAVLRMLRILLNKFLSKS